MNQEELEKILADHKLWLSNKLGNRADLQEANLRGADLRWANLRWATVSDTILSKRRIRYLKDAISLGRDIFNAECNIVAIAEKYNLYIVPGENKAVIAFAEDLSGGFCFVHHRKEIWWWNRSCPNPETVTVLWKMEE